MRRLVLVRTRERIGRRARLAPTRKAHSTMVRRKIRPRQHFRPICDKDVDALTNYENGLRAQDRYLRRHAHFKLSTRTIVLLRPANGWNRRWLHFYSASTAAIWLGDIIGLGRSQRLTYGTVITNLYKDEDRISDIPCARTGEYRGWEYATFARNVTTIDSEWQDSARLVSRSQVKVMPLWDILRRYIATRGILWYWHGEAVKRRYAPGGEGRMQDRLEYEEDFLESP